MQSSGRRRRSFSGVTLVELTIAILLIAILATATTYMVGDNFDSARYEATRAKLEKIRTAILGDPAVDNEGRRTNFGYMGDMGKFPDNLGQLTSAGAQSTWAYDTVLGVGAGWRGPYYQANFTSEDDVSKDAWGTSFVYSTAGTITSYGANKTIGGSGFDKDLSYVLTTVPHRATVYGYVADGDVRLSSKTVVVHYPAGGALTSLSGTTDTTGLFSLANIPFGIRAFKMTTAPTIGPKTAVVDKGITYVSNSLLNYNSSGGIPTDALVGLYDASNNTTFGYSAVDVTTPAYSRTTWRDLVGRFGDITLSGFAWSSASGWNGTGTQADPYRLVFDGTGDYGTITHANAHNLITFTFSAWVNLTAGTNFRGIITKDNGSTIPRNYWFGMSDGTGGYGSEGALLLLASAGASLDDLNVYTNSVIDDGAWHHIAATVDGANLKSYLDGTLHNTVAYSTRPDFSTSNNTLVGRDATGGGRYITGSIAQIAIYNRALNAKEIAQICYAGKPRFSAASCPGAPEN